MKTIYIVFPFHKSIAIHTSCEEVIEHIRLKYPPYVYDACTNESIEITINGNHNEFIITNQANHITTSTPMTIINTIIHQTRNISADFYAFHGAAIEKNTKVYVFLASTKTGKTTLTCYLNHNGFGYMTDDCILINKQTLAVHPFVLPMNLRLGGLNVLKQSGINCETAPCIEERYIVQPMNICETPQKIGAVFFLNRTDNYNLIENCSYEDKFLKLLCSSMTVQDVQKDNLSFIQHLSKIPCFNLKYSKFDYVVDVINKMDISM